MTDEYSVCQFSKGAVEYVARSVNLKTAVNTALRLETLANIQKGTTQRIISTNGGDKTYWEWNYSEGVVYPPRFTLKEIRNESK